MNIHKYLPTIYDDNLEMQSIATTEEKEFANYTRKNIDDEFKNTFVLDANEKGVLKFEKLFSIVADESTETLEFRKERILNRLISQLPFTLRYFENRLDTIIGVGNWNIDINYNNYTLDVYITTPGKGWLDELKLFMENVIPCNIQWTINIYAASWQSVKENFATWNDVKTTCDTWQDVLDALWLN